MPIIDPDALLSSGANANVSVFALRCGLRLITTNNHQAPAGLMGSTVHLFVAEVGPSPRCRSEPQYLHHLLCPPCRPHSSTLRAVSRKHAPCCCCALRTLGAEVSLPRAGAACSTPCTPSTPGCLGRTWSSACGRCSCSYGLRTRMS